MAPPPTLLFIPGAWHKPTCFDKVIKLLDKKLRCTTVELPSTKDNPKAGFKDDIDAARQAIARETSEGHNVVVIAHSYGGMVGNSAIKGFARPTGNAVGKDTNGSGYVIGLILIASGYTLNGLAFMDPFLGHPPPAWRVNHETGYADLVTRPQQQFYHDLPADEADYWTSQLTTQSLKALFEDGEYAYAGWQDVPSWYIGTTEDQGMPVVAQRMTVGMARQMGGNVQHRELQTSHSPFLSQPDETAAIILEAVESFTGESITPQETAFERKHQVFTPRFNVWQIRTWFRYGVPLGLGHFIGRIYLIFTGVRRMWQPKPRAKVL